ncbi:2-alkenal reductase [Rhodothermaceae bacterium RA]|nr:2-alkenal reductase [Rhodothermaceae bacterium RA]
MRAALLFLLTLLCLGCQQPVRSQESLPEPPPQRVEPPAGDVGDQIQRSRQTAITRAVEVVTPAVVSVNVIEVQRLRYRDPFEGFFNDPVFDYFFGQRRPYYVERPVQSLGSGFIISPDGYLVTNDHVAGNATEITVAFPDGRTLPARLVGTDPATDIALLKIDTDEPLPYLTFAEDPPIVGEWVIALGNPFGLFEAADPTVTVGVVSATNRDLQSNRQGRIYRDMIQTDAAINRGNSGGPLVNALGEVIGVNTAIYSESGGSIGIGFAVPAAKVRRIVEEVRTNGAVDRSYYTGLYVVNMTDRIARALGMTQRRGLFVRDVDPDSPAAQAGILPYDVILSIEGEAINSSDDYVARIYDFRPGDRVSVRLLRDGEERTVTLQIGRSRG